MRSPAFKPTVATTPGAVMSLNVWGLFTDDAATRSRAFSDLAKADFDQNEAHWKERCRMFADKREPYRYYRRNTNWVVRHPPHTCGDGVAIFRP